MSPASYRTAPPRGTRSDSITHRGMPQDAAAAPPQPLLADRRHGRLDRILHLLVGLRGGDEVVRGVGRGTSRQRCLVLAERLLERGRLGLGETGARAGAGARSGAGP